MPTLPRMCTLVCVAVSLTAAPPASWAATDLDILREDLRQAHAQFQKLLELQQQTQRKMDELQQKLEAIEATRPAGPPTVQAPPTAAPVTAPTTAVVPETPLSAQSTAQAPQPGGFPSAIELVRPREPFALYKERGAGQLLFDMGVTGDFVGAFTSSRVEHAQAGTFPGFENQFWPREVELSVFGQIDPYARAEVRIEAGQEIENGQKTFNVTLAEANFTLQTLPFGTQAKIGLERLRFGLLNDVHEHDLPQTDRPNVLVNFLGPEGLVETGAEVTWIPPLPFYLQVLGGVFNGDNEVIAGWGRFSGPLGTARVRSFFETERYGALQVGLSAATGETPQQNRTGLLDFDWKYKYTPEGWRHALVTLAGEALVFRGRDANDATVTRWGLYTYAELHPWERWVGGLRVDWSQFPSMPGSEWALEPYVTFLPSEFLKFRLAYKYTKYSSATTLGVSDANEVLVQASFILGAHPAHPF
jgi:hypothetical protein